MDRDTSILNVKSPKQYRFFGRRRGKKLSARKEQYIKNILPNFEIKGISNLDGPGIHEGEIGSFFGDKRKIWIEIGFGSGEHLVHLARKNPDIGLLGCEPFVNGVASLIGKVVEEKITNIRIFMNDASKLLDLIPIGSVEKVFLLFPDPWQKLKHRERRFINENTIAALKRIMEPGGLFYIATDAKIYVRHVLENFIGRHDFEWLADASGDWKKPWNDWVETRYSQKAHKAGAECIFLVFRKKREKPEDLN